MITVGRTYDHPTPLEFIYRFRILIFNKNYTNIRFSKNIEKQSQNEEFLSFSLGQLNKISPISRSNPMERLGSIQLNSLFYLAGYVAFKCKKIRNCKYAISEGSPESPFYSTPFS